MEYIEFLMPVQKDYELLDAGEGMKLERFGSFVLSRPDPEALFPKTLSQKDWDKADARFIRKGSYTEWVVSKKLPASWTVSLGGLVFQIKPTSFKHVGLFPEQVVNWLWIQEVIKKSRRKDVRVLNLFGYTGGASLAALQAGAVVTHIDGSKTTYSWCKKNQELSGLKDVPIRFLIDDAVSFLRKELKRGNVYDAIIMDPPSFGHGPNGELWKIEEGLIELFTLTRKVLSDDPVFFLVNGYSAGFSTTTYINNLLPIQKRYKGELSHGELLIPCACDTVKKLPAGISVRWKK